MSGLKAIITEDARDEVADPLRIAFLIAFATGIALQVYTVVWQGNAFDFSAFGTGAGVMIGGTGAALWASSHQKETSS